jgi:hypothetical protein
MGLSPARTRVVAASIGVAAAVAMGVIGSAGAPHVDAWVGGPPPPMTVGRTSTIAETTVLPAKAAPTVKAPHS